jgi:hypothetical protein
MKRILKILLVLSLCINANNIYAQRSFFDAVPNPYHPANQNAIQDGWYEAIVHYSSHTGQESTYKLNVKVENLVVVVIDFGNGGYVHRGPNNSAYHYRGGGLYFERNQYGEVVAASTTVDIYYDYGGWQKFQIYIQ